MDNFKMIFIKTMFVFSVVFTVLFAVRYCWGIYFCAGFYDLLDYTLPVCCLLLISDFSFGISSIIYCKGCADKTAEKPKIKTHSKKINYERRYIIKTYSRSGVCTKHINLRGDYGLLKSA